MKCPACKTELKEMEVSNITVDVCSDGCGGIWFDNFELQKVDEQHEAAGEQLLDIKPANKISIDFSKKRSCPKCNDIKMMKHFVSIKREVEIDECPGCAGIWLDYGELGSIRNQFKTEEERKKAAREYFSDLFNGKLDEMRSKSEVDLQRAKNFAKMFRFICPSYYIPSKQEGGAF